MQVITGFVSTDLASDSCWSSGLGESWHADGVADVPSVHEAWCDQDFEDEDDAFDEDDFDDDFDDDFEEEDDDGYDEAIDDDDDDGSA